MSEVRTPGTLRSGNRADIASMIAMMALFFLVVCAVGILRPIRNALALDGLGSTDFYKVYLVSAVVVFFVPIYNRLADRVSARWLIPAVALFFASNLLLFRAVYTEGSTIFGLAFYGWYDLFAAALVTQFFMATQMFFDARLARRAYPMVIAGGSLGATLGGAITGFFAETVGTPNLMLVAAGLILLFSAGIPMVWRDAVVSAAQRRRPARAKVEAGELRGLLANRQVRLIAGMVLITILVKQLVDYEFNTLTKAVFEDRDAISAFQGKFNAATQWLPIVVLAGMQPALRRWGVGLAVLLLPVAMLLTSGALVIFFGLWAAVAAKGAETALRYSAERAGREILYVPIPTDIKLKAKTYIDVAIEKGVGKVASAGLIFLLLLVMDYRWIPAVGVVLAGVWVAMALAARGEYVNALAVAMQGRFASLDGVFASLVDASSRPVLERALKGDARQVAFALDLIDASPPKTLGSLADPLHALLDSPVAALRARSLGVLTRHPDEIRADAAERRLGDDDPAVREAAVRASFAAARAEGEAWVDRVLSADRSDVRAAVLACITRGELGDVGLVRARATYASRMVSLDAATGPDERVEAVLAAAALGTGDPSSALGDLIDDADPRVSRAALRCAAGVGGTALLDRMVVALRRPATREAAREALAARGEAVLPALAERLLDPASDPAVRRAIPAVLARIPSTQTVETLVRCALAAETEQLLDFRVLKALSKLHARNPELTFDRALVDAILERETRAAAHYAACLAALNGGADPAGDLLGRALREAWAERREGAFRALGLVHGSGDVYRCYLAVVRDERVPRANALEWLETTLGHRAFARLEPVLRASPHGARGDGAALRGLCRDEDAWLARCASRLAAADAHPTTNGNMPMDAIEKVLLLQRVDLLRDARSAHLALIASIADEVERPAGSTLLRAGEPADALWIVVEGTIDLRGAGTAMAVGEGDSFGTWSLIDEAPSVIDATAATPARLLRIGRDEFHDLLSDYPELAIGLLQGLARRMRSLVA